MKTTIEQKYGDYNSLAQLTFEMRVPLVLNAKEQTALASALKTITTIFERNVPKEKEESKKETK